MPFSTIRAALLGLALALSLPALAAPDASPVRLLAEQPAGLELAWTPGAETRVLRVALPPGTSAVLPPGSPPGLRLEEGGWFRRVRFARLVLEPGVGPEQRARLDFVPDPGALLVEAPAPGTPSAPPEAFTVGVDPGPGMFLNEATARRAEAAVAERPELRPRPARRERPGHLRRRLTAAKAGGADEAGWSGGSLDPVRSRGFENGRVLIEVGLDGLATVDRGDGVWRVRSVDGVYRVSWRQLADLGIVLEGVRADELRLTRFATQPPADEVAIHVEDADADGLFGDGDWFEFFGQARTFEDCSTCFQNGDYTDVNGYVLDSAPGARLRMPGPDPSPAGLPDAADHPRTLRFERGDRFVGRLGLGVSGVDHFYWCPPLTWAGGAEVARTETVELPGLLRSSTRPARVGVHLLGRTTTEHRSLVDVNGFNFSDISSEGALLELHDFGLESRDLRPDTDVTVRLPGSAADVDQFELDWIEVEYPAALEAADQRLLFEHEGGATFRIAGFTDASDVTVLEVGNPLEPRRVEPLSAGGGTVTFAADGPGTWAVTAHPAPGPLSIRWMPATTLRDPANDFDLLVFGPRDWLFEPGGALRPAVQEFVDARQGQGLAVLPVAVEDAIDEFTGGIRSPGGVFYLLQHAVLEWAGPPDHALLLGDTNIDYKNQLQGRVLLPGGPDEDCTDIGEGSCGFNEPDWVQHVMTLVVDAPGDTLFVGHYAADARLATVVGGDFVPEVAVGRLPARSVGEADALLRKAVAYDELADAPPAWGARVHFAGDQIDPGEPVEQRIESAQEQARLAHVESNYTAQTFYYQSDYGAVNPELFTSDFLAAWTDPGAGLISYVGHGNALNWSDDQLLTNNSPGAGCRNDVADSLTDPAAPQPIVVNVGCITGAFMREVGPSLLEEMVRSPGGAIAAYGPTGLTDISLASTIVDGMVGALYGRDGREGRLGDAVLALQARLAIAGLGGSAVANALLGDPTLRPAIPWGPSAAAVALEAVPGDGLVSLSWPAVPGADSYTVHRSVVGSPDPPAVAGMTAATSLDDSGVVNGTLYEYRLEAFSGSWPGRWSAPVRARPCTTVPPEPPSNLTSTPVLPQVQRLTWDPSPTAGLAGYRLRVWAGPQARGEPLQERETSETTLIVAPLEACREYTYEVRALGWCELESATAATLTERAPDCPELLEAPRTVRDLRLSRDGGDLVLDWSPVETTLQGTPFTPARYVLHRATAADFFADAGTFAGQSPSPDLRLAGEGGPGGAVLEFFSVAAESGAGLTGGIGRDFPLGVRDLTVEDAGADWRLTWSPVTEDLERHRTALLGYQVHAGACPLDRAAAGPATLAGSLPPDSAETLVDKGLGDCHLVLAEDVHGNLSPW